VVPAAAGTAKAVEIHAYALRVLRQLDEELLRLMRTRGHSAINQQTMQLVGAAGEWGAAWVAGSLLLASTDQPRRRQWLTAASAAPVAIAVNYVAKLIVRRPRPRLRGLPRLGPAPSELSFPSAHASSSFAAATVIARVEPRLAAPSFAFALAICATRPYLGLHYPSDVVAGAAFGVGIGRAWLGLISAHGGDSR